MTHLVLVPKHRLTVKLNYLLGITLDKWFKLLRRHRIDAIYWHRATLISMLSIMNSLYQIRENRLFGRAIQNTVVAHPPIFIIGHWRSGTTHLLSLLGLDNQFAIPNSYQVTNPYTFLVTEEINAKRWTPFMLPKRPMDNMHLSFESPQEDEFALCLMTLTSVYLGMSFPRHRNDYLRYMDFSGLPPANIANWQAALSYFAKKLALKYPNRTLMFKSPPHTAKISWIMDLFPEARFIHIYRQPYRVFQSTWHLYDTLGWYWYMQYPDGDTADFIIRQYQHMYRAFFAQRHLIPKDQYVEVAFEQLGQQPVDVLERIYDTFDLTGFAALQPKLERYLASITGYQQNCYPALPQFWRDKIAAAWRRNFEEWGYGF